MNESFYQLYKSMRELVKKGEQHPLSDNPIGEFIRGTKLNCERHDRANKDFYNRWLKEQQDEQTQSK